MHGPLMASIFSTLSAPPPTLPCTPKIKCTISQLSSFSTKGGPTFGGIRLVPKIQNTNAAKRSLALRRCLKTSISCSIAQRETLSMVQSTIAKQLSIDESTATPQTKFSDWGADFLDTRVSSTLFSYATMILKSKS